MELVWFTNPLKKDTDGDGRYGENGPWGLDDWGEAMITHTDPTKPENWQDWNELIKLLDSGSQKDVLNKICFWVVDHYRYLYSYEAEALKPDACSCSISEQCFGRYIFEKIEIRDRSMEE